MLYKTNKRRIITVLVFFALLFIRCWDIIPAMAIVQKILKHIDELFTLVLIAYVLIDYRFIGKEKNSLILAGLLFWLMGWVSTIVFRYQPIVPTMIDALLIIDRFFVGYLATVIFCNKHGKKSISQSILIWAKFITIFIFGLAVVDVVIGPIFPRGDYRLFMNGLQLFFPHATYLAAATATLLIYFGYMNSKHNDMLLYMLMNTIVTFCTMRSKAMGFVLLYWMIYIFVFVLKNKHVMPMMLLGAFAAAVLGYQQIDDYFLNTNRFSPRSIMLKDGLALLWKHFPFGTGFGSYGASVAINYYSPLYVMLGYPENRGMSPEDSSFLTDCFWPTVFAQFGFIGSCAFIVLIVMFLKLSIDKIKKNRNAGFAMLATLLYLLISSMAESSFFNPIAFLLMIMFAIYEKEK